MEEQLRKADERLDDLLEKSLKLEMAVQRLTEHEGIDRPKYEEWHKDVLGRLIELEKVRRELEVTALRDLADSEKERIIRRRVDEIVNGKLTILDDRQRKMERTLWMAGGATTIITSLVVIVVNVIVKHL